MTAHGFRTDDCVVAIVGRPGVAKSALIRLAVDNARLEKTKITSYKVLLPDHRTVTLVDTSGFSNRQVLAAEVFRLLADWLAETYSADLKLSDLVYIKGFNDDVQMSIANAAFVELFRRIVEEDFSSVVFVRASWMSEDQMARVDMEWQPKHRFWQGELFPGACETLLTLNRERVLQVLQSLRWPHDRPLALQKELIDERLLLSLTDAGKYCCEEINVMREKAFKAVREIDQDRRALVDSGDLWGTKAIDLRLEQWEKHLQQIEAEQNSLAVSWDWKTRRLQTQRPGEQQQQSSVSTYPKLGPDDIRLVVLRHGEADAPLEVQIQNFPFDDTAEYDALSYSVGPPANPTNVNLILHGQQEELVVSLRLNSILRHLRDKNRDRVLWIDALSINQADFEERAREVRRLGKIFVAAQNVCIWLGEAADNSDLAMDFVPEILDFEAFDKLVRDEAKKQHWLALAKLMAREWFTRRWVVQEMALARNATVYCGDRQISWSDLAHAATLFGTKWHEIVLWLPPMEAFMLGDAQTPGATSLVELSSNIFRMDGSRQRQERRLNIEALLDLLPMFDVTVPLDAVYSIIDIAYDTYETDKVKIDYKLEPRELFGDVVKLIIEGSGSMDVICRPWAPVCDLPTWITTIAHYAFERRSDGQYFRQNADSLVGSPGRSTYRASGNMSADCRFELDIDTGLRMLNCIGIRLGHVKATGGRSINGSVPREWRKISGWLDRSQPVPEAFWRTLGADRGAGGISAPSWYKKACEYSFRRGRIDIDISQLIGISKSSNERSFLQRVQATTWNRVFFTMNETGKHDDRTFNGLGPAELQVNDQVFVLGGCSVPVVLRPRPVPQHEFVYELVGETFVYGFMDGEAAKEWRKGNYLPIEISIR